MLRERERGERIFYVFYLYLRQSVGQDGKVIHIQIVPYLLEEEESYCLFIAPFPLLFLNKFPGSPAPKHKKEKNYS